MKVKLTLLLTSLFVTYSVAAAKVESANDLIQLKFSHGDLCVKSIESDLFIFKSCIDIGLQAKNTLIDVANFSTFGRLKLSKQNPYTNCKASKKIFITYRIDGEEAEIQHKISKAIKVKYHKGKLAKKLLAKKINEESHILLEELKSLPSCSSLEETTIISANR